MALGGKKASRLAQMVCIASLNTAQWTMVLEVARRNSILEAVRDRKRAQQKAKIGKGRERAAAAAEEEIPEVEPEAVEMEEGEVKLAKLSWLHYLYYMSLEKQTEYLQLFLNSPEECDSNQIKRFLAQWQARTVSLIRMMWYARQKVVQMLKDPLALDAFWSKHNLVATMANSKELFRTRFPKWTETEKISEVGAIFRRLKTFSQEPGTTLTLENTWKQEGSKAAKISQKMTIRLPLPFYPIMDKHVAGDILSWMGNVATPKQAFLDQNVRVINGPVSAITMITGDVEEMHNLIEKVGELKGHYGM